MVQGLEVDIRAMVAAGAESVSNSGSSNLKGAIRPSWERCAAMLACRGFRLARGKGTPTSLNPIWSRKLITCTSSLPGSKALPQI